MASSEGWYARDAHPSEYKAIVEAGARAFISDPPMNYFGSVKSELSPDKPSRGRADLESFLRFLLKAVVLLGGRVTVVAKKSEDGAPDQIAAAGLWQAPNKRIPVWNTPFMIRAGVLKPLRKWGLNGLLRCIEMSDKTHAATAKAFKTMSRTESPDECNYAQLIFTDPNYQGHGLLSPLMYEAFAHCKNVPLLLDANTARARDRYVHYGAKDHGAVILGKGKVNADGYPAKGADAPGVSMYTVVQYDFPERKEGS